MVQLGRVLAVAAASLALGLQGCTGNSYNSNAYTTPCVLPSGVQASLVYPAPNSTGNTVGLSQVIVATNTALPSSWDVVLVFPYNPVYGSGRFGATIQQAQPPFPSPSVIPPNPPFSTYYSSGFNNVTQPLPPGTLITATLNDTSSNCSPGVTLATFST